MLPAGSLAKTPKTAGQEKCLPAETVFVLPAGSLHLNCLIKTVLMWGHNYVFHKNIPCYPSLEPSHRHSAFELVTIYVLYINYP